MADPLAALTADLGATLMVIDAEERARWHQPAAKRLGRLLPDRY